MVKQREAQLNDENDGLQGGFAYSGRLAGLFAERIEATAPNVEGVVRQTKLVQLQVLCNEHEPRLALLEQRRLELFCDAVVQPSEQRHAAVG